MDKYQPKSRHAPKQTIQVGATIDPRLSDEPQNDLAATALEGMVLYTDCKPARPAGFKRAKKNISHVGVNGHKPRNVKAVLGVCNDTITNARLLKSNPQSVGSISAVVGGAITIVAEESELSYGLKIGDVAGVFSLYDDPGELSNKEYDYKFRAMQIVESQKGYTTPTPIKLPGGLANDTSIPDPTGASFEGLAFDVDHDLVAATALDLGQQVNTTAGATTTFDSDLVVGDKTHTLDPVGAATAFAAALTNKKASPLVSHVVATVEPQVKALVNKNIAAEIGKGNAVASSLVATAASLDKATNASEYLGIRKLFKSSEKDLAKALRGEKVSKATAHLAAVAKALTLEAPAENDRTMAKVIEAAKNGARPATGAAKKVVDHWGLLQPHTRRSKLPTHAAAPLPKPSARNTVEAEYANRLACPTMRRLVMNEHPNATSEQLLDCLKEDLGHPDKVARYVIAYGAGLGTKKANLKALKTAGMSNNEAKAALAGLRSRTREEMARNNDKGAAFDRATAVGHIDNELATAINSTASDFGTQWTAPQSKDWIDHQASDGTKFRTKFDKNRAYIHIDGAIDHDTLCVEPEVRLDTGATVSSDWLGFVDQPGEYSFPIAPTGVQFTGADGTATLDGEAQRYMTNTRNPAFDQDIGIHSLGRVIDIDKEHGLYRIVLDIQPLVNNETKPIRGLLSGLTEKYDDDNTALSKRDEPAILYMAENQWESGNRAPHDPNNPLEKLGRPLEPMQLAPQQPIYAQVAFEWASLGEKKKVLHQGTVLYATFKKDISQSRLTSFNDSRDKLPDSRLEKRKANKHTRDGNVTTGYTFDYFDNTDPKLRSSAAGNSFGRIQNAYKRGWATRVFLGVVADTVAQTNSHEKAAHIAVQIAGSVSLRQEYAREYEVGTLIGFDNNRGARVIASSPGYGPHVHLCTVPAMTTSDYDDDALKVFAERETHVAGGDTHAPATRQPIP